MSRIRADKYERDELAHPRVSAKSAVSLFRLKAGSSADVFELVVRRGGQATLGSTVFSFVMWRHHAVRLTKGWAPIRRKLVPRSPTISGFVCLRRGVWNRRGRLD